MDSGSTAGYGVWGEYACRIGVTLEECEQSGKSRGESLRKEQKNHCVLCSGLSRRGRLCHGAGP